MDACRLWVNLASPGHRGDRDPGMFLHFRRTGLLVGLPDEPGVLIGNRPPARLVMTETDAAGLGLDPDDLADGVAICRDHGPATPWRCEPIDLLIGEPDGDLGNPGYESASRARESYLAERDVPPPPPFPLGARLLLLVTDAVRQEPELRHIAELARRSAARVTLAVVGELPETPEHAAEEREALGRHLAAAATYFHDTLAGSEMELGGDPVHGLLAMLPRHRVDLVVIPGLDDDRDARALGATLAAGAAVAVRVIPRAMTEDAARPAG